MWIVSNIKKQNRCSGDGENCVRSINQPTNSDHEITTS